MIIINQYKYLIKNRIYNYIINDQLITKEMQRKKMKFEVFKIIINNIKDLGYSR